jgi:hypothetical protein
MENNQKFTSLSEKLKCRLEEYERQLGMAILVIVFYLKMKVYTGENNKYAYLMLRSLYNFGWFMGFIFYRAERIKRFIVLILSEFHSVLILKEKTWISVNEKIT